MIEKTISLMNETLWKTTMNKYYRFILYDKLTIFFFLILMVLLLKRSEPYISYGNYSNDSRLWNQSLNKNYKYEGIKMEIHPSRWTGILTFLKLKFPNTLM